MSEPAATIESVVGGSLEWVWRTEMRILREVLGTDPVPLLDVSAGRGVYLLLYGGTSSTYRQISDGSRPIYIGETSDFSARRSQHITSISQAADLRVADFWVVALPLPTEGATRMAESTLQALFRPVWNHKDFAGFGSRNQGKARVKHQPPTAWDQMHPGREWARPRLDGDPQMRKQLRRAAKKFLSDQPTLPSWSLPGSESRQRVSDDVMVPLASTSPQYTLALSHAAIHVVTASVSFADQAA